MFSLNREEMGKKQAISLFFLGALAGILLNVLFALLGVTAGSEAFRETAEIQFSRSFAEGLFLYGVVAPILEEVLFRLIAFGLLRKWLPFSAAMVVSALLFGVYHGNLVQASYGFLMGMILGFWMEKYGKLSAPILFHAGANIGVWTFVYLLQK